MLQKYLIRWTMSMMNTRFVVRMAFSRLHYSIATDIINTYNPKIVLDVGCGTGFQSFLHASAGAFVVGIDIADKLIEVAEKKSLFFKPRHDFILFPVHFEFVDIYNKLIGSI